MPRKKILATKAILKKAEDLAARGVSQANIAYACGMCEATLYNRIKDDPEFRAALKKGRARAEDAAAGKLWELIEQGSPAAIIFYLKSRCGWKEGSEVDIKADVSGNVQVNGQLALKLDEMSIEQLQELANDPALDADADSLS